MSATAAAIGAGAALSLGGGIFSNKTNKKIARETNALNYKMFQEANQFNREMWDLENQYNLPVNQKKRLLAAGVNPAALVDAPQLGAAASGYASVSPPQMQGYQYQNVLGNVSSDLVALTQAMKNTKDAELTDIQSQNYELDLMSQIDLRESQGLLSKSQADWYRQEYDLRKENWDELIKQAVLQNQMSEEEARKLRLANDLVETYGDAIKKNEVAKTAAEVITEIEKGNTEKAHQKLMGIQGDQEKARTVIQRDAQRSQAAVNQQTIRESKARERLVGSQITAQDFTNKLNSIFGENERWIQLGKDISDGKIKDMQALEAEIKRRWYDPNDPNAKGKIVRGVTEFTKWLGEIISNVLPIAGSIKFE